MIIKMNEVDVSELLLNYTRSMSFTSDYITGNVPTSQLDVSFDNDDGFFNQESIKNTLFEVQPSPTSEKLYFKVYEMPETWDKVIELKLYDICHELDVLYTTELAYPTTISEQLFEMSVNLDIDIEVSNIPSYILNKEVGWYDSTHTIREHIGWVACLFNANVTPGEIYRKIKFEILSKETFGTYEDLLNYKKGNDYCISKVSFNNGFVFEKGTSISNTYLLDPGNMYISKQDDIDNIAPGLIDLSVTSVSNIEAEYIENLHLGYIIESLGFRFIVKSLTEKYIGGNEPDYEMSGELTTTNQEQVGQKITDEVRVKRLKVLTDEIDTSVTILAEQTEDNTSNINSLAVSLEGIETEVSKTSNAINKFETGTWNIFNNTYQELFNQGVVMDMPLDIDKEHLRNRDICISVNVLSRGAIYGSGFVGAEFEVSFVDGSKERYMTRWYAGQSALEYILEVSGDSVDKRIYCHYKIPDKEIAQVSSLKLINTATGELIYSANPKVEFGEYPTGYQFDVPYVRDNVEVIQKDYTQIKQEVSTLSLKSVSMETEITTIKGDVTEVEKRLQSTELKLTPTAITAMVNEQIGADGQLKTVKVTIDKNGLDVKNGAISITNNDGVKVLYADTNGNLVGNKITINNLESTSGKIGRFGIDDKGFNYSESVSISGKACTFTLAIHPDARDSFLNWKLRTNDGSASDIVGALTYSGIECNSVGSAFHEADQSVINTGAIVDLSSTWLEVGDTFRVWGSSILEGDTTMHGNVYFKTINGGTSNLKSLESRVLSLERAVF